MKSGGAAAIKGKAGAAESENDEIDEEEAQSAEKEPSSTYSDDSYSEDMAEDQSENMTDVDKDSSVIVPSAGPRVEGALQPNRAAIDD